MICDEKTLKQLFDIQKFVQDEQQQLLLDQIGSKYDLIVCPNELSDEEMEVFAAGDPALRECGKRKDKARAKEDKPDDY